MLASARRKRQEKKVDIVVANDVSRSDAGFEVDANEVTIVSDHDEEFVSLRSKTAVAIRVLERIEFILRAGAPAQT